MASEIEREAERVRGVYARRSERGLDSRYEYWQPANLFIYHSRERALLTGLRKAGALPLGQRRVLDVGCGEGRVLLDFLRYGASAENLRGIDLLPERVEAARRLLPEATIDVGDAQALAFEDGRFNIVLGFTLLSSVLGDEARRRIAGEMLRVVERDGLIVLYDFRTNPINHDARPLRREDVLSLFPGCRVDFYATTLAPPLVRALTKLPGGWLACSALEVVPFLRTHFVALIRRRQPTLE